MVGVVVLMAGATLAQGDVQEVLDIGSRLDLFVDAYLIEALDGTALDLHHPVPKETAIRFDRPWEGAFCGYVTVLDDGGTYRMYYRGLPKAGKDGSDLEVTCYAESADGITFSKPNLGLFEVDGTKDNNVILAHVAPCSHNFAPFLDARPGAAADERYKALAGTEASGLVAFVSPDGIHWRKLQDVPVITKGAFDSQNVAFWSESEGCYVCYFRTWSGGGYEGYRTVSRATSQDFVQWSEPVDMTYGARPPEHIYTNQTLPYFRAPHLYIAAAARFMPGRRVVSVAQAEALGGDVGYSGDCSDTVLMTSRGGSVYDRTFMEGFVRPGIGLENWTSRTNYPTRGIVPCGEAAISLYVQRCYSQPSHHLQRLELRTDGFVSVNAPYAGGEMVTKPLRFTGKELAINVSTSAAGSVWVEVQDAAGKAVAGYTREACDEVVGDEIARVVSWKGNTDVSALAGTPIRLRFVMKDADLYAVQFR
ncbi:MAG TPA: hypothetical protein PLO37_06085 [Candidatus Hydrogenedentes bacterium]|nr:hypothetical protein [Candidatus Hydrogenedentota bacterium]HPG66399.1 hypothetical protein [Candidatus Hydrogenedentota bacterium]